MLARSLARFVAWSNAPRRRTSESGSTAVEFALVLPLLVMLLMGVVTGALAYGDHVAVQNAVREGSRLGSAIDYSAAGPSAWATSVRDRVKQVYFNSGTALTDDQICVKLYSFDASGTATAVTGASAMGTNCGTEPLAPTPPTSPGTKTCAIKVWVAKSGSVTLGLFPSIPYTISARAVDYYGRTVGTTCISL
jgi:Flp pilus assembly protein TadG